MYDATHRRTFTSDQYHSNANLTKMDTLRLYEYQGGVEYRIEQVRAAAGAAPGWRVTSLPFLQATGKCTKVKLGEREVFVPIGVPDGASYSGGYIIGSAGVADGGLEVMSWAAKLGAEEWRGFFTAEDCVPVRQTRVPEGSNTDFHGTEYYNVVLGLSDPTAFVPPANCQA